MPSYSGTFTLSAQMQANAAGLWPSAPGAPTSVVATPTYSSGRVSVAFTAPSNLGIPASITGYTVTSSPGGITATGSSSPIVVTGLTDGTAYTFTVTATNNAGTGPASAVSNSATPVAMPTIGAAFGGGYFAGQISTSGNGVATHNLVVADKTVGESYGKKWGSYTVTNVTSGIDGPSNTTSLANLGAAWQAATFCEGLNIGGYTDWYMPAQFELEVCYFFLKPTTTANDTSSGANPYAVSPEPRNTNYSSGTPAQTTATNFRSGASSQEFNSSEGYWTSTESSQYYANGSYLAGGNYTTFEKQATNDYVRAIRRVAV